MNANLLRRPVSSRTPFLSRLRRSVRIPATTLMVVLVSLAGVPTSLWANPVGGQVIAGQAGISSQGPVLSVFQQSQRAIINWNDFSILNGETTRFIQPGASAAVLNRVTGGNISSIYGTLQANGKVYLINPNGVMIGPSGRIDAGSFIASTLDVDNSQFMAGGNLNFLGASTAKVTNLGTINATSGDVFLIAREVENAGTIKAPNGTVGLAAGSEVLLTGGTDGITVQVAAAPANPPGGKRAKGVTNSGSIEAAKAELKASGGNMYALAINNSGTVRATKLQNKGGTLVLTADGANITNTGTLRANGGTVVIDGSSSNRTAAKTSVATVRHSGVIDVSDRNKGGKGGYVQITGDRVAVEGKGKIDASGSAGGGMVVIGGGFQGKSATVNNANKTYVGPETQIAVDAIDAGKGGNVVVWSNEGTQFYGGLSARGGAQGGDGGYVEISGKEYLGYDGHLDLGAAHGAGGTVLFDPDFIIISNSVGTTPNPIEPFSTTGTSTFLDTSVASVIDANANVIFEANNDITLQSAATITTTTPHNFTLHALGLVDLQGNINLAGGNLTVQAASVNINGFETTNAGNMNITGDSSASLGTPVTGVNVNGTVQATGAGTITITGKAGGTSGPSVDGVTVTPGGLVESDAGTITINGFSPPAGTSGNGISLSPSFLSSVTSNSGVINLNGTLQSPSGTAVLINAGSSQSILGTVINITGVTSAAGAPAIAINGAVGSSVTPTITQLNLTGDYIQTAGSTISLTATGVANVKPSTANYPVHFGEASSATFLGLDGTDIAAFNGGPLATLKMDAGTGPITINGPVTATASTPSVSLVTTGNYTDTALAAIDFSIGNGLALTGNTINLTNGSYTLPKLAIQGGTSNIDINLTGPTDITSVAGINGINAGSSAITLNITGGNLTQSAPLITSSLEINSDSDVTLTGAGNNVADISGTGSGSGQTFQFRGANGYMVGIPGVPLNYSGAGDAISLTNDAGTVTMAAGGLVANDVSLHGAGAFDLTNSPTSGAFIQGNLTGDSTGNVSVLNDNNLFVGVLGGNIIKLMTDATSTLTIAGNVTGASSVLLQSNILVFNPGVLVSAPIVQLLPASTGLISLDPSAIGPGLNFDTNDLIYLSASNYLEFGDPAGNYTINVGSGSPLQNFPDSTRFTAGTGATSSVNVAAGSDVTSSGSLVFQATGALSFHNSAITSGGNILFSGPSTFNNSINIDGPGGITFNGATNAGGPGVDLNLDASTAAVTFTQSAGATTAFNDVSVIDSSSISINVFRSHSLFLNATGAITLNGDVDSVSDITLDGGAVNINALVQTTGGGNLTVVHTGVLTMPDLGDVDITGNFTENGSGGTVSLSSNGQTFVHTTGGSITFNSPVTVGAAGVDLSTGGSGDISLANSGNALNGPLDLHGNNVSVEGQGTVTLHTITATNLDVVATGTPGDIVDNGPITATNATLTAVGQITITPDDNNITALQVFAGALVITSANAVILPQLTLNSSLQVNAGGDITQTGYLDVGGISMFNAPGHNVILTDANNQMRNVRFNANNVDLVNNRDLIFGPSTVANLDATVNGVITQTSALNVSGAARFDSGTHNLTLTNSSNRFGSIELSGAAVAVSGGVLNLSNIDATAGFTATASSSIKQSSGTTINSPAGTTLSVSSTGSILIANTGNVLGPLTVEGGTVSVASQPALVLAGTGTQGVGTLTVTSQGDITQTGALQIDSATMTTPGDIDLGNSSNQIASFAGSAHNVTLANSGAIVLGPITAGNALIVTTDGDVTQAVPSSGTTGITAASTVIQAGSGNIDLTQAGNNFGPGVELSGANVAVHQDAAAILGNVTASGTLDVTTIGDISVSSGAIVNAAGAANFNAGTNGNIAFSGGHHFGSLGLNGRDATADYAGNLVLTTSALESLDATATGSITGATPLLVSGTASFAAGTNINLSGANQFGLLQLTAANATVRAASDLLLGASTITNTLSLTATGAIAQNAPIHVDMLTLNSGGAITLNNPNNKISGLGDITRGGDVNIAEDPGLTIFGHIDMGDTNSSVTISTIGGNLTLAPGAVIAANGVGHDITLATDHGFVNQAGAEALRTTNGSRYVIYASSPDATTLGGLNPSFQQFSTIFPTPATGAGNGIVFASAAPVVPIVPINPSNPSNQDRNPTSTDNQASILFDDLAESLADSLDDNAPLTPIGNADKELQTLDEIINTAERGDLHFDLLLGPGQTAIIENDGVHKARLSPALAAALTPAIEDELRRALRRIGANENLSGETLVNGGEAVTVGPDGTKRIPLSKLPPAVRDALTSVVESALRNAARRGYAVAGNQAIPGEILLTAGTASVMSGGAPAPLNFSQLPPSVRAALSDAIQSVLARAARTGR